MDGSVYMWNIQYKFIKEIEQNEKLGEMLPGQKWKSYYKKYWKIKHNIVFCPLKLSIILFEWNLKKNEKERVKIQKQIFLLKSVNSYGIWSNMNQLYNKCNTLLVWLMYNLKKNNQLHWKCIILLSVICLVQSNLIWIKENGKTSIKKKNNLRIF